MVEEIRDFLEYGGGTLGGSHQFGCCGLASCGFDTRCCFIFRLRSERLMGRWRLGLRLLGPGCLSGGGHLGLLGQLLERLRRGSRRGEIWSRGYCGGGLDNKSTLDDVVPPFALARCAFGAADWPVPAFLRARSGTCLAIAARASFHFTQPR
jgi:hypothetical protein